MLPRRAPIVNPSLKQLPSRKQPLADTLKECHDALLKEAQGQLAAVFVAYEESMLRLLQDAACEEKTLGTGGNVESEVVSIEKVQVILPSEGEDRRAQLAPPCEARGGPGHTTSKESPPLGRSLHGSPATAHGSPGSAHGSPGSVATLVNSDGEEIAIGQAHGDGFNIQLDAMEFGRPTYKVDDFYKKTGWPQRIARDELFHHVTLGFIMVNALYLGLDADLNTEDVFMHADLIWIVSENIFCLFFTGEILVRFFAFETKSNCLQDGWFRFDSFLVALMIFEVWGMMLATVFGAELSGLPTGPLRLLRLLRLSRLSHLLGALPELVTMIKGMKAASRAVASCVLMVLSLVYVFSIMMLITCSGLSAGTDSDSEVIRESLGRLSLCMWTMLMTSVSMVEAGDVMTALRDINRFDGYLAILIFVMFMLLSALTVLNMLIGVLCQVVTTIGEQEREDADMALVKIGIFKELQKFDSNGDGTITQAELDHVMRSEQAQAVMDDLGVDKETLEQLHAMFFPSSTDSVPILTIVENCLQYRGSQPPTVKHLIDGMVFNRHFTEKLVTGAMDDMSRTLVRQTQAVMKALEKQEQQEQKLIDPSLRPLFKVADTEEKFRRLATSSQSSPAEGGQLQLSPMSSWPMRHDL